MKKGTFFFHACTGYLFGHVIFLRAAITTVLGPPETIVRDYRDYLKFKSGCDSIGNYNIHVKA